MAVLPIITIPDPILRKISDPVERVDDAVVKLMDDMLETMYAAPGIGLAAIQVGIPKRVVVIDAAEDDEPPKPIAMANPAGAVLRNVEGGSQAARSLYPDVRHTSPENLPRSPVIGTDAPVQYEQRDDIGAPRKRPPSGASAPPKPNDP